MYAIRQNLFNSNGEPLSVNLARWFKGNTQNVVSFGNRAEMALFLTIDDARMKMAECKKALSGFNIKATMSVVEISDAVQMTCEEYFEKLLDVFANGDTITRDEINGEEVVEHKNDCGCLLSRHYIDKSVTIYY